MCLTGAPGATAQQQGGGSLHDTNACSVPRGYTFDSRSADYGCGNGAYNYHLLDYVYHDLTGYRACQVPPGYVSRGAGTNYSCSPGTTSGRDYLLARS